MGFVGSVAVPGAMGGLLFRLEKENIISFFERREYSKNHKKSLKIFEFFDKLKGNFAIFWKILSIFSRKFMENLENFGNVDFSGVPGAEPR